MYVWPYFRMMSSHLYFVWLVIWFYQEEEEGVCFPLHFYQSLTKRMKRYLHNYAAIKSGLSEQCLQHSHGFSYTKLIILFVCLTSAITPHVMSPSPKLIMIQLE